MLHAGLCLPKTSSAIVKRCGFALPVVPRWRAPCWPRRPEAHARRGPQVYRRCRQKLLVLASTRRARLDQSTYIIDDSETVAACWTNVHHYSSSTPSSPPVRRPQTPTPSRNADQAAELSLTWLRRRSKRARIDAHRRRHGGTYGKGKYCPTVRKLQDLEDLSKILAESRDPKQLLAAWTGWHAISRPMRPQLCATWSWPTRERGSSASRTMAPCGGPNMICRPTPSRRNWTVFGNRSGRSTFRCTPTTQPPPREVWRPGARQWSDSGAPAGQHVAQDWDNIYPLLAPRVAIRLRFDRDSEKAQYGLEADGEVRRKLFCLAGLRSLAANILGALPFREAAPTAMWCAHASALGLSMT